MGAVWAALRFPLLFLAIAKMAGAVLVSLLGLIVAAHLIVFSCHAISWGASLISWAFRFVFRDKDVGFPPKWKFWQQIKEFWRSASRCGSGLAIVLALSILTCCVIGGMFIFIGFAIGEALYAGFLAAVATLLFSILLV